MKSRTMNYYYYYYSDVRIWDMFSLKERAEDLQDIVFQAVTGQISYSGALTAFREYYVWWSQETLSEGLPTR